MATMIYEATTSAINGLQRGNGRQLFNPEATEHTRALSKSRENRNTSLSFDRILRRYVARNKGKAPKKAGEKKQFILSGFFLKSHG
ncbi:uncharacterized protein N7479_008252 [Penicillium vulpinum]|uniref:uncharacterized protein n=1 Tax=Penicillium vulpinum TaxID=29845 RepID=UPI0025499F91|nr:uncharacterized protein N7479_008252 [Penicillium vulpinum]KAJ5961102.1 hypothetical protein N7479_008252 [Penicillium vulpinum]